MRDGACENENNAGKWLGQLFCNVHLIVIPIVTTLLIILEF